MQLTEWIYILVVLLSLWNGIARELRNGLIGYELQTALIGVLYAVSAVEYHDLGMWIALAGLIIIRAGLIPWLMMAKLPPSVVGDRLGGFLLAPTYAILVYLSVAGAAFGLMTTVVQPSSMFLGAGLATLLVGLAAVTLSHDAGKQVLGLLTADNGIDLFVVTILARISALGDYVIFVDIALTVVLLLVLIKRLSQERSLSIRDYHQLRG